MKIIINLIFIKYFLITGLCFISPVSLTNERAEDFEGDLQENFQLTEELSTPNLSSYSTSSKSQKIFQSTKEVSTTTALISFYAVWKVTFIHENFIYSGSGFFIEDNKFVTALHVVNEAIQNEIMDEINLTKPNHLETIKIKKVLALSNEHDLALLETNESVSHYLPVREQALDDPSEPLAVLGYPKQKARIIRSISQINSTYEIFSFNINHSHLSGASGGPVIDSQGQVVAVSSMAFSNNIKVTELRNFISDIETFSCGDRSAKDCLNENLDLLHQRAENGKASAQYKLGLLYEEKEDPIQTEKWFSLAAQQGHPIAQSELGRFLSRDISALSVLILGWSKTMKESIPWFRKAAEQDYSPTQYKLALIMIQDNMEEALLWFKKSAEAGFAPAQYELAMILKEEGKIEEAVYWLKKAEDTDYTPAQYELAMMLADQDKWETALPLFRKAGEKDDVPNEYASDLYELGLIMKDENQMIEATDLFTMAMEQGHWKASYELVKLETQKLFRFE